MKHLSSIAVIQALQPYLASPAVGGPYRKQLDAPHDDGLFVKPIKQAFIRNPRLMPGTRIMLTILAGWAGRGGPIETTLGIIGKHVGRSTRQVQRYLKDAIEEGYLRTSYVKDPIGRVIGLRVYLTRLAIFHDTKTRRNSADSVATTSASTNKENKTIFNCWQGWLTRQAATRGFSVTHDEQLSKRLAAKGKALAVAVPEYGSERFEATMPRDRDSIGRRKGSVQAGEQ